MGAWIETDLVSPDNSITESHPVWVRGLKQKQGFKVDAEIEVAPCMGAWIETDTTTCIISEGLVAPCMGAWIET